MIKNVIRYKPPKEWGVLCIDIWEQNGKYDKFYRRTVEHLKDYNVVVTINASKSLKIDYNDISIYNVIKHYIWKNQWTYSEIIHQVRNEFLDYCGTNESSKILKDNLFNNQTICLNNTTAIANYVDQFFPTVRDWIILGQAWGICLHNNPVSIKTVLSIVGHNFNIFPDWSVSNSDQSPVTQQQIEDDNYVWAPIDNNGYRLVTQAGGVKWQK